MQSQSRTQGFNLPISDPWKVQYRTTLETLLTATDPTIPGWFESTEGRLLLSLCAVLPAGSNVVELGSFAGKSSRWLYGGCKLSGSKLTCIDIFTGRMPNEKEWAGMEEDIFAHVYQDHLIPVFNTYLMMAFGVNDVKQVKALKKDSVQAAKEWIGPDVDLLFVDDDHVRCREVVNAWIPRMAPHGLILFHDVHPVKSYGPDGPINTVTTMIVREGWRQIVSFGLIAGLTRDPFWWNTRTEAGRDEYGTEYYGVGDAVGTTGRAGGEDHSQDEEGATAIGGSVLEYSGPLDVPRSPGTGSVCDPKQDHHGGVGTSSGGSPKGV